MKLLIENKVRKDRVLCSGLGREIEFEFQLGVYAGIESQRLESGLHVRYYQLGLLGLLIAGKLFSSK